MSDNIVMEIDADDGEEFIQAPARKPRVAKPRVEKRTRIILEDSDEIPPGGQYFSIMGEKDGKPFNRNWMIQSGEEVEAPEELIGLLNASIVSIPIKNPATKQVIGYRDRQRFPYRVLARDI